MPVFGKREANPEEKSPGEWVTDADKATETFLEPALRSLIPGSSVVGEEGASFDPSILERLSSDENVWLIDPLDGTSNFAQGIAPFALMIAYIRNGTTVASWILDPVEHQFSISEKGAGSWINGAKIEVGKAAPKLGLIKGAVLRRFLPLEYAEHVNAIESSFASLTPGSKCAGFDYPAIANGTMDFALYWRTLPWDHAPGVLFLQEAGGYASRLDGSEYLVADHATPGLLVAHNEETWSTVKSALIA